jgi:hypothetical protein
MEVKEEEVGLALLPLLLAEEGEAEAEGGETEEETEEESFQNIYPVFPARLVVVEAGLEAVAM